MKKLLCAIALTICLVCTSIPIHATTPSAVTPQSVQIVSPSTDTVYTKDLLISLRVSEAKKLKLRVEKISDQGNKIIHGPITYENNSSLNFYITQINNIDPGDYKIIVDEVSTTAKVVPHYEWKLTVKEKPAASSNKIFNPPAQNNTLQVIQTFFKNILGGSDK